MHNCFNAGFLNPTFLSSFLVALDVLIIILMILSVSVWSYLRHITWGIKTLDFKTIFNGYTLDYPNILITINPTNKP